MRIAICLCIKDENQYLEEWLNHYIKLGVDHFYMYDNESKVPVVQTILEIRNLPSGIVDVIEWHDNATGSQQRAYLDCTRKNQDYNYVGFLDTDEFYMSKTMDIKRDFWNIEEKYGKNDALGFYWRVYGQPKPYLEQRQPADAYTHWFPFNHIKSFVRPNAIINFPDPHKANIEGRYIDELGRKVERPVGEHTSEEIYIKHIYTRSIPEWQEKITRGSGDKVNRWKTMDEFYRYNDQCVNHD